VPVPLSACFAARGDLAAGYSVAAPSSAPSASTAGVSSFTNDLPDPANEVGA
jgi:hypothetical protein